MFSLTTTHLRFVCEATTTLRLEADTFRAGSNLRGALGHVMLRSYCPHPQPLSQEERGEHAATCPVHWLLAANETPGEERRGYALVPPLPNGRGGDVSAERLYMAGDLFEFGLTLFGNAQRFLPYFILTVPEMGRGGVGPGRGKFVLKRVWALNPLTGESECLFGEAGNLVRTPTLVVDHEMVMQYAEGLMHNATLAMDKAGDRRQEAGDRRQEAGDRRQEAKGAVKSESRNPNSEFQIEFLTPMRLIDHDQIVKTPEFVPLFARLLKRVDELHEQFAGGARRAWDDVRFLQDWQAQLVDAQTRWVEVFSGSNRRGMPSPMSGFVGRATYAASLEAWRALLPWLVWGELIQVGRDVVKGNGVMSIADGR
jgi:hypothetical protein